MFIGFGGGDSIGLGLIWGNGRGCVRDCGGGIGG